MRHARARTEYLLKTEGVRGLVMGARRRVRIMRRALFTREDYVVYRFSTDVSSLPQHRPDVDGLDVAVLESETDVTRLVERGYDVPVFHPAVQTRWLQRGGVAFCAFVGQRLAHIAWVALREDARGCCDGLPYLVDFAQGEACWGGSYTWLPFRGLGLYRYVCGIRLRYLHDRGFHSCRDAVAVRNVASQRGQGWWRPHPCVAARYSRFLRWTRWEESPLEAVHS
jgi:hypothetical protein